MERDPVLISTKFHRMTGVIEWVVEAHAPTQHSSLALRLELERWPSG